MTLFIVYKYAFLFSLAVILEYLKVKTDFRSADQQVGNVLNLARVNMSNHTFLPGKNRNLVTIDAIT